MEDVLDLVVSERYKLVGSDLQWQVHELRDVEKEDGSVEEKWTPLQSYHSNARYALEWLLKTVPRKERKDVEAGSKELAEVLGKFSKDVARNAKKFDAAVSEMKEIKASGADLSMAEALKGVYGCLASCAEANVPPDAEALALWKGKLKEMGVLNG